MSFKKNRYDTLRDVLIRSFGIRKIPRWNMKLLIERTAKMNRIMKYIQRNFTPKPVK